MMPPIVGTLMGFKVPARAARKVPIGCGQGDGPEDASLFDSACPNKLDVDWIASLQRPKESIRCCPHAAQSRI